jgi:menaquinone-specific isochorismate synthase
MTPAATAEATRLVARTVPLPDPPDLLAIGAHPGRSLWLRETGGLAGVGTALRLALPGGLAGSDGDVNDALSALRMEDEVGLPGCGPVAMGALPFDRTAPAEVVVPRVVVGRQGDRAWLTTVGPRHQEAADPTSVVTSLSAVPGGSSPAVPPDGFSLTPSLPHARWKELIAGAVAEIAAGHLAKVVLARRVDITANRPFAIPDVLGRLSALYPSCMLFHMGDFLGASPELLIERRGRTVRSYPLAGTVARSGDLASDQRAIASLVASAKERSEHRFVVDALAAALAPACTEVSAPDRPEVLGLRNVSHLATPITGNLRPGTEPTALDLVGRVHPTPAVAGTPTGEAVAYLGRVEGFDRGKFAGPVGWVDARGDGTWALGIRSAVVVGERASIFAGVGIVADSDPASELQETQLKLQALLAALVRP